MREVMLRYRVNVLRIDDGLSYYAGASCTNGVGFTFDHHPDAQACADAYTSDVHVCTVEETEFHPSQLQGEHHA
ncbi:hypothetical protein CPT_Pagan_010 [Xanthomonas phage Pagan]|uniref:Uncharacterized protein n=1 Tax=Xanthomonas phage Pagan TaxID=2591104 RepID=A0A5B9NFK8_9CAUD|nr:hypothetical protein CPT_Pagan_010 [Xanthomonas phage Pagan]